MIIGTVTYPSDTEWSVTVTDLGPGTHNFVITDDVGSPQVDVDLFVTDTVLQITSIEAIYGGFRLRGVIQPGRELIIAP